MRIDLLTLFPDMCRAVLDESIIGRAQAKGLLDIRCHQIRDYTLNKQKQVDDYPYGGGLGMVMDAQPIADCFRAVCADGGVRPHLIYMSPQGAVLTQQRAKELAQLPRFCVLCGHYEGVDERVLDALVDEQISMGDYVLTGGELPALALVDCVSRLVPGVLSEEGCFTEESPSRGLGGPAGPRRAPHRPPSQHRPVAPPAVPAAHPPPSARHAGKGGTYPGRSGVFTTNP